MTEPTPTPSAVDKAFAVLRAIGTHEESALGLADVARATGLPKSTALRLLRTLERNGALRRDGDHYRLGALFEPELRMPTSEDTQRV